MTTVANLVVKINGDMSGIEGKLSSLQGKFNKFGNAMTLGVTLPVVAGFKKMLDAAMHLEATEAKFNTVFKGMTKEASAFIKEFKKLTPLTTAEARGVASGIQDLLVPMGFLREDATKLTGKFMPLIGALANFNNATHTAEEVARAVSSALVGEYEPMRRLGVVTSKTAINQRVLAMGLAETDDAITDQMRAMALHEIITESSKDAIAAYTEANLDAKTKMGLLLVEITDVAAELGQSLIPMITSAMEWLKGLTEYFSGLTREQQETILKVLAFAAAIGPASKVVAGIMGLSKLLLGLSGTLLGVQTSAQTAAGATGLGAIGRAAYGAAGSLAGAGVLMLGTLALILAAIGLIILAIKNWEQAWRRIPNEMKNWSPTSAGSGKGASFTGGGTTGRGGLPRDGSDRVSNQWFYDGQYQSTHKKTSSGSGYNPYGASAQGNTVNTSASKNLSWAGMFDTGGIVPGPRGSAQLALVHGGETILPTHKSGGGGMGSTIRHEIDLVNVPSTVDKQSLQTALTEMLNSPQVKRKIDRINYENTDRVRGLGL